MAESGRGDPAPRRSWPGREVRLPAAGPERPQPVRVRPRPREHPDVRDPLPGGDVRGPPRDRGPPPGTADVRVAFPAREPVAPRVSQPHDALRETGEGDA